MFVFVRRYPFALPLVGAAACWGVATVISKRTVAEIPPLTLLPIQLAASVTLLAVLLPLTRARITWTPALRRLAALGVLNPGISYALGLAGLAQVTAADLGHRQVSPSMRIGLIGLGRIGSFHADTLAGLSQVGVSNTRTNARGYDVRLEVHGTQDSVAAGLDDGLPLRPTQPGVTWPAGPPHTFFMDRLAEAFRRELATFCEVAAGAAVSPCTVEDAMGTAWVAEAATLSAREHRPVRIDEVAR